ncbi:MAG: glutathione S-transferase family protein [Caulobacterales bacterium]
MITVHSIPGSPFGRAVLATLIEKNAPHRLAPLGPGEAKGPAHLARQPFGRVPAIDDDGFVLYETQAILRYIDQKFPDPALTPKDPKAAARMNQLMGINDWYFFPKPGVGIVFNRVVAPKFGMPVNEEAVAAAIPEGRKCIGVIADILGDKPYLAGDALSLADLHLGPQLDMFAEAPEGAEILKGTPIPAWLARLNARPSFQKTTWDALLQPA